MSGTATKRLFVAIFPPPDIAVGLRAAVERLRQAVPPRALRWTRPEQIHLTMHFLGAVAIERIPGIASALQAACRGHRRHQLRLAGFGCFPNQTRPQIIWASLAGDLGPLESLQKSVNAGLLAVGCVAEDRPFHPHLTIGRARDLNATGRKAMAEALAAEQDRDLGQWQVDNIALMQSMLSPQGAAYETLQSITLGSP
jgi:2'-5' RNA ligase